MNKKFLTMLQTSDNVVQDTCYKRFAQLECLLDSDFNMTSLSYKKILQTLGADLNYKIPLNDYFKSKRPQSIGLTLLESAFEQNQIAIFDLLIEQGADFTMKNQHGLTILHQTVKRFSMHQQEEESSKISRKLGNSFINSILLAHVNHEIHHNPGDKDGFSHFHVACMTNKVNAVKFFIANGISVNEAVNTDHPYAPGYTSLHFASKFNATEVFQVLMENGANISFQDAMGRSPVALLVERRMEILIAMERCKRVDAHKDYQKCRINFQKNEQMITLLLKKLNPSVLESGSDLGLTRFHVLCTLDNAVKDFLDHNKVNIEQYDITSSVWPGYTALHFAVNFNIETFKLLLEKGANIKAQDAKGLMPFDIALRCFKIKDIHSLFSVDTTLANVTFSDGKTKLSDFIHAMTDPVVFDNYLKSNITDMNMFIPLDSPICPGYSPLHFTVCCTEKPRSEWVYKNSGDKLRKMVLDFHTAQAKEYIARIKSCLDLGSDIALADSNGSTPLHIAFHLQESRAVCELLMHHAKITKITNPIDKDGLSHLHIACASKLEALTKLLLLVEPENVNLRVKSSFIWYDLSRRQNDLEDVGGYFIEEGSTPLHIAALVRDPDSVDSLIEHKADVLAKDADNLNPLERVLEHRDFWEDKAITAITKSLAVRAIQVLTALDTQDGREEVLRHFHLLAKSWENQLFQSRSKCVFLHVLRHANDTTTRTLETIGVTRLLVACVTGDVEQVSRLLGEGADPNQQVHLDSPFWAGNTALHHGFYDRESPKEIDIAIFKLLLSYGADVTLKNASGKTPLHRAFDRLIDFFASDERIAYVKDLLKGHKDFNVNPVDQHGMSHFHIACALNATDIVKTFLRHGVDVNQATEPYDCFKINSGETTPLHAASTYMHLETVDILLNHGADVHARNLIGSTALHCAVTSPRKHCQDLLRRLIRAGADVNAKNLIGQTPLELLFTSLDFDEEEVRILLEAGALFTTINPINRQSCMALALYSAGLSDDVAFITNVPDVKNVDELGNNAIHSAVSLEPDWENRDHDDGFVETRSYTQVIDGLINLGLDINHRNGKGFTPLHTAVHMQNATGIEGLLNNGCDVNAIDASGHTALFYNWEHMKLANTTKDSKKVDRQILEIFLIHLSKLHSMGLDISIPSEDYPRIGVEQQLQFDTAEFQSELESTETWRVDSYNITIRDFLSETGAVAAYPFMMLSLRQELLKLFTEQRDKLREKFPQLMGIIMLQYGKALVRRDYLIRPAMACLPILLNFDIPAVCSVFTLRYLSNTDLNNLIESANISD